MFDDFNFIIHPIKQEWLPWHNIFGISEAFLTFLAGGVFPLVWSVAPNYCIEICLHECDSSILAFGFFQQNFWAESVTAGFIEKFWCSFFAQFLYFSIQRFLFSVGLYESGFIDSFWSSVPVINLHLSIWIITQSTGTFCINRFFSRRFIRSCFSSRWFISRFFSNRSLISTFLFISI